MANYKIYIPNNDSDLQINPLDSITVCFKSKVRFSFADPVEFMDSSTNQYISHGTYKAGDCFTAIAQNNETVDYSYKSTKDAGVKPFQSGVRTIIVGSTKGGPFTLVELEKALESDPPLKKIFCECWPCAEALLKALIEKLPVPVPVKDFLDKLFDIGDKAYKKLCTQKRPK